MDQPKLERLLRIMQLMTDKRKKYTVNQLSDTLSISQRSVYRYIDTFESVGFIVRKSGGHVWLAKESKHFKTIADLVYFTEEEAYLLKCAVESLDSSSDAINGLKTKLYSLYDFSKVAQIVVNPQVSKVVNRLMDAIASEKQVLLKNYHSSHSGNVSDRLVEPIQFGVNMLDILCFEVEEKTCKSFKIKRIDGVELLDSDWKYKDCHEKYYTDAFRFSSTETMYVKLKMTMVAANLLAEEYPMAEHKIVKNNPNEYIFEDYVCSYEGVGRFVLGLSNEIEVLEDDQFIKFLHKKIEGRKF